VILRVSQQKERSGRDSHRKRWSAVAAQRKTAVSSALRQSTVDEQSSKGKMNFRPFDLNGGGAEKRHVAQQWQLPFIVVEGSG
jgi:hypothetical protein